MFLAGREKGERGGPPHVRIVLRGYLPTPPDVPLDYLERECVLRDVRIRRDVAKEERDGIAPAHEWDRSHVQAQHARIDRLGVRRDCLVAVADMQQGLPALSVQHEGNVGQANGGVALEGSSRTGIMAHFRSGRGAGDPTMLTRRLRTRPGGRGAAAEPEGAHGVGGRGSVMSKVLSPPWTSNGIVTYISFWSLLTSGELTRTLLAPTSVLTE